MKHTPGPWEANRNSSFWEINPTNGGENGIPFSVADVCSSAPGFPDGGLQEANARLIAAAPELLGYLKIATAMLKAVEMASSFSSGGAKIGEKGSDLIKLFDDVIAKATGENQ